MGELGELRNKVDQAVDRLSAAHEARRRQSQGLMTLLTDLETKFEARNEEVEHCRQRIEALTRENADLSSLVDKLVMIVDTTVSSDDEDALFRASATAADLVADWSGPGDGPETASDDDADDEVVTSSNFDRNLDDLIAAKLGYDPAAEAFAELDPAMGFQDVGEEELASEELRDDPNAVAALLEATPAFDIDDEMAVQDIEATGQDINEPFEVIEFDDPEIVANSTTAEPDADGIDMPEIHMADIETAEIDIAEIDSTGFDTTLSETSDSFDPVQERLSADLDIPEISLEDDEPISRIDPDEDTESSIRAMMARLEQAAARAKAYSEEQPEAEVDEVPAVAVGGRS